MDELDRTRATTRSRERTGRVVLLFVATAAIVALVLAAAVVPRWLDPGVGGPAASPSASQSRGAGTAAPSGSLPQEPASAAASASAEPSVPGTPPAAELEWSTVASFPSDGGPSMVEHLVALDDGYLAVGVAYAAPLPNVGPTPPHNLRMWRSVGGREWEAVELGPEFENVRITGLVRRDDDSLLAFGTRSRTTEFGYVDEGEPAAWTSPDGRTWTPTESALPGTPSEVVQGGRGAVALVRAPLPSNEYQLWHSADGAGWELAHSTMAATVDVGAGEEGFVVLARATTDSAEPDAPFALASGDGREWFEAQTPPPGFSLLVAAVGDAWVAANAFGDDGGAMATGETWASADGLQWRAHGQASMGSSQVGETECSEHPRTLQAASDWVVMGTQLSYPCSEGGFAVHGTQLISTDGAEWQALPFETGTPGQSRSGALINAAASAPEGLILAGEENGAATFWFGEPP